MLGSNLSAASEVRPMGEADKLHPLFLSKKTIQHPADIVNTSPAIIVIALKSIDIRRLPYSG